MNRTEPRCVAATSHDVPHPFKRCTLCGAVWDTPEAFLRDRHNRLEGYQFNIKRILAGKEPEGLLIFTHKIPKCGTSLAVSASSFRTGTPRGGDRKQ